jgi:hypothetical protein
MLVVAYSLINWLQVALCMPDVHSQLWYIQHPVRAAWLRLQDIFVECLVCTDNMCGLGLASSR